MKERSRFAKSGSARRLPATAWILKIQAQSVYLLLVIYLFGLEIGFCPIQLSLDLILLSGLGCLCFDPPTAAFEALTLQAFATMQNNKQQMYPKNYGHVQLLEIAEGDQGWQPAFLACGQAQWISKFLLFSPPIPLSEGIPRYLRSPPRNCFESHGANWHPPEIPEHYNFCVPDPDEQLPAEEDHLLQRKSGQRER